jgi:hypothetical protein
LQRVRRTAVDSSPWRGSLHNMRCVSIASDGCAQAAWSLWRILPGPPLHCSPTWCACVQVCVRCGKEKPAAAFNRNKVRPDGLCSYCKVCNAAAAAERRKTRQPVLEPTVSHKVRSSYPVTRRLHWALRCTTPQAGW